MQVNDAFNEGMAEHLAVLEASLNKAVQQVQASAVSQLDAATSALHAASDCIRQPAREQIPHSAAAAATCSMPHTNANDSAAPPHDPTRLTELSSIAGTLPAHVMGIGLSSQFQVALARQAPEVLLVPFCLAIPPENARELSAEFRVCIAQQLVTVLPVAREEVDTEVLIDWVTECLMDVQPHSNAAIRGAYAEVLSTAAAAVKALRSITRYRSQVDHKAAELGTMVMNRQASLP
jgi:hypothetical protein